MLNRIRHMAQKEFIQVFRDKRMRFVLFLVPVIQLVLFGYVVTTDVRHIAMGVYDLDNSPESRALVRAFTASGYFEITHRPASQGEITRLLDEGKVLCVIVINAGFSKALARGLSPKVQILFDATDSNTTTVAIGYAKSIIGNYAGAAAPAIEQITVRPWFNPELKSKNYNVPGVAALIVLVICLMLTSMSVVREREIGTMEQLLVTPLRPIEILLGKTIPFGIIGVANMIISVTVAVVWFDVPIRGSIALLFFCTLIYLLSILGIGLLISTISRTQQQAMMAAFLFNMPTILLSGFMFPIQNMPEAVQYATLGNPLRYYLVIIREIFLKGSGVDTLWPQITALFVLGVLIFTVSALRFKQRIE